MRTVTNVVKPGTAERLANARRRLDDERRRAAANRRGGKPNPATARTVSAALAAYRKPRRNGRGIFG